MRTIRLGIIGAGWIAKQHLEVIHTMSAVEVVGITSRTRFKAEALASEYAIPAVFDNLASMVESARPDALMVLVSCDQMYEVTAAALTYGLPLFIEKPAGLIPEENRKLAEIARKRNISTMVGFNRRYYSIFHKGIDVIKQQGALLGILVEGHERMWRVREAGKFSKEELDNWIFANSVHTIDLLRFFGGEVKNLHSITHHRFGEARGDQFASIMELESGAIGEYIAHWYSPGGWRVVLFGDGVTVEFKPLEKGVWYDKTLEPHEILPDEVDIHNKPGLVRQMEAFERLVRGGRQEWPALDLEGAYKTMQLAEQMTNNIHGI
ncbi:MAG: Gfo/Idh/MocA family oxidoreductase [bacterium]|nr:Gfo/Idh/MocA family oxidoreductase [bacterium]